MDLPIDFLSRMRNLLGNDEAQALFDAIQKPSPVSIRLNPNKSDNLQLSALNSQLNQVPWSKDGRYLEERLTFTFDPLFHAGVYYVQEASSMFLEQAVKAVVQAPVLALDLCAAPGGKSTHLRSLLPEGSLLVANEVIRNRSQILAENLTKWGHPDVMVTNNDPADFDQAGVQFDFILADVPCSGEGMFRKDEGAINEWSPANVEICRQRQRRIIADIWPCLKPNGILVYSTCTFNTKENEENIDWIISELGAQTVSLNVPADWGITGNLAGTDSDVYRFLPHKVKGEGFFMAVLRKNNSTEELSASRKSSDKRKRGPVDENIIKPSVYHPEQEALNAKLRILKAGISLGTAKGKDFVPSHDLAMTDIEQRNAYPKAEITYHQAISYLRREAIVLDSLHPRGYVLLTYKNIPLGFVKNLGNRANNLYPQEWRIKSGYLPQEVRALD